VAAAAAAAPTGQQLQCLYYYADGTLFNNWAAVTAHNDMPTLPIRAWQFEQQHAA
jgi:hypothetical protein